MRAAAFLAILLALAPLHAAAMPPEQLEQLIDGLNKTVDDWNQGTDPKDWVPCALVPVYQKMAESYVGMAKSAESNAEAMTKSSEALVERIKTTKCKMDAPGA